MRILSGNRTRVSIAAAAVVVTVLCSPVAYSEESTEGAVDTLLKDGVVREDTTVGGGFFRYHNRTDSLFASPGAMRSGLLGFANPAMPATTDGIDAEGYFSVTDDGDFPRFGLYTGAPFLGFGVRSLDSPVGRINDYRVNLAADLDNLKLGLGYGWHRGKTELLSGGEKLGRVLSAGALVRPSAYASLGLTGTVSLSGVGAEAVADLAVRPFGNEWLAFFGEYAADTDRAVASGRWSAGAVTEPLSGVRFTGRYVEDRGLEAGVSVSLGNFGVGYRRSEDILDEGSERETAGEFSVRAGSYDRNIAESYFADESRYLTLDMDGQVTERPAFIFDPTPSIYEVTDTLDKARRDPTVGGVLIDATNLSLSEPAAHEISRALERFRDEGGRVVLYLERAGMDALHLIAQSDRVAMDPEGGLTLPGYASSSTYLAELLDRVGIGVVEFRQGEYKSALETLTREGMSEEEREQRRAFVDQYYTTLRETVTHGRDIETDVFDELIDYAPELSFDELKDAGLVDASLRFNDIDEVLTELEGTAPERIRAGSLADNRLPRDNEWGPRPKIGVVYASGMVATDMGMRAREIAGELRSMRKDPGIEGVVLRVNSPGGDILASDLISEEVQRLSDEKPTAVSMAGVAASGGYWISMHADRIFALSTTLTGSIGVISGWSYDEGLRENLRLNEDSVQRGDSADLFTGPVLPLIGLGLPPREPDEREREQFNDATERQYDTFVEKVSEARNLEREDVERIAAGRVWTGEAAVENGLIDETGTLHDAIAYVRNQAGISDEQRVSIVQGPGVPLVGMSADIPLLAESLARTSAFDAQRNERHAESALLSQYIESITESGGTPQAVMPFEHLHWYYRESGGNR
ncbi:MAG: S49 family peptidase [Spirochaetales bacterium]